MGSVLDDLRREDLAEHARMTPDERIALSERLGDEALDALMEARGVDLEGALLIIARSRRAGRRPSRCLDENR
jgi:hypothetical protein